MDIELIDIVHAIRTGTDQERDMLRQALSQLYQPQDEIERLGALIRNQRRIQEKMEITVDGRREEDFGPAGNR